MVLVIPGRRQRRPTERLDPIEVGVELPLHRFEPLAVGSPAFDFIGPRLGIEGGALSRQVADRSDSDVH